MDLDSSLDWVESSWIDWNGLEMIGIESSWIGVDCREVVRLKQPMGEPGRICIQLQLISMKLG